VHIFAGAEGETAEETQIKRLKLRSAPCCMTSHLHLFAQQHEVLGPRLAAQKQRVTNTTPRAALKCHINLVAITSIIAAVTTHMQLSSNSFFKPSQLLISQAPNFIRNNGYFTILNG
jgi:hypothetical protein